MTSARSSEPASSRRATSTGLVAVSRAFATRGAPILLARSRDGWTLTDWFENVYLALAGPRRYDDLAAHRIPWTDPIGETGVATARRAVVARERRRRRRRGALATTFEGSVRRAFGVTARRGHGRRGRLRRERDHRARRRHAWASTSTCSRFPRRRVGDRFVVGGGDAAVMMHRSPAAEAFVRYLATPQAAAMWAALRRFRVSEPERRSLGVPRPDQPDDRPGPRRSR